MSQINSKNTEYDLANALIELTNDVEYKDISISSVAFKANMHRNTVYYHFADMRDLCFFAIHNELSKALRDRESVEDAVVFFFYRFKPLLDYTKTVVGTEDFLMRMRNELIPILDPLVVGPNIDSGEKKRTATDIFAEQILVAYLLQARPAAMLRAVFENVMPQLFQQISDKWMRQVGETSA